MYIYIYTVLYKVVYIDSYIYIVVYIYIYSCIYIYTFSFMRGNLAKGSDSRMDVGVYKMDVKNGCENGICYSGNIHFPQMQLSWCFAGCLS